MARCKTYWQLSEQLHSAGAKQDRAAVEETARQMRQHAKTCRQCITWFESFKMPNTYCDVGWNLYDAWEQLDDDQASDDEIQAAWNALRDHCATCEQCGKVVETRNP